MSEKRCDAAFMEQVKADWRIMYKIDACTFPRLLELAESALNTRTDSAQLTDLKDEITIMRIQRAAANALIAELEAKLKKETKQ